MSDDPSPTIITSIEELKNKIYQINKLLLPIKEFLIKVDRESMAFVDKKHQKYYTELKDLCFQIYDYNDSMERILESKINLFFSFQGQKMNQVMKTLTIVSTIFIPLTFIAGLYGMNFKYIPELDWQFGYFSVLIIMVILAIVMLFIFKKKKLL
jgi:magnesium transporter